MKWPWVSRHAFDAMLVEHTAQRVEWGNERRELLNRIADYQRHGYRPPEPTPPPPPSLPGLPAQVVSAIQTYVPSRRAQADQSRMARVWMAEGVDAEEITQRIQTGAEPHGD